MSESCCSPLHTACRKEPPGRQASPVHKGMPVLTRPLESGVPCLCAVLCRRWPAWTASAAWRSWPTTPGEQAATLPNPRLEQRPCGCAALCCTTCSVQQQQKPVVCLPLQPLRVPPHSTGATRHTFLHSSWPASACRALPPRLQIHPPGDPGRRCAAPAAHRGRAAPGA